MTQLSMILNITSYCC